MKVARRTPSFISEISDVRFLSEPPLCVVGVRSLKKEIDGGDRDKETAVVRDAVGRDAVVN